MKDNEVECPLVGRRIEAIDCVENTDAVEGMLKKDSIPEEFKKKENWIDICKNCKWHNY